MLSLIEQYITEIKESSLSFNTKEAYIGDIERLRVYLEQRSIELESFDKIMFLEYVQFLKANGISDSSIARNVVSIRRLYKFISNRHISVINPLENYEVQSIKQKIPKVLTVEEVDRLLNCPDTNTYKGIRDKAMLEIMYAAGIKVTELLCLTMDDVNIKLNYIICRGASGKERVIPIGSYAVNCIIRYIEIRHNFNLFDKEILFFNSQGTIMTRQGFWKLIKSYAKLANINKDINTFTLRHSFAVHLIENGADLKSLQQMLGHTALSATQVYYNMLSKKRLAEVYRKSHPRA